MASRALSYVARSHRIGIPNFAINSSWFAAAPINRADRFTALPMVVYSRRTSLPTDPQKIRPVATPMELRTCRLVNSLRIISAACTPARGIILMRERRQTQRGNDGDALIVHIDLVDAALIAIHGTLDQAREILRRLQVGVF